MSKPTEIIGYWFAASDVLPNGDGRKVVIGETLRVEGEIIPCKHGLHASINPFNALRYAPGLMLYKVRLSGEIIAHNGDKYVASERTALACHDSTEMLRAFARRVALSVIHLWNAPSIVQEYLETGNENKRADAYCATRLDFSAAARAAGWATSLGNAWETAYGVMQCATMATAQDPLWIDNNFNQMVAELFSES